MHRATVRCRLLYSTELTCPNMKTMSTFRQFGKRVTRLASFTVNKLTSTHGVLGRVISGIVRATGRPVGSVILRRPPSAANRQLLVKAVRAGVQRSSTSFWRSSLLGRIVGNSVRTNSRAAFLAPWLRSGVRNQRLPHHRISLSAALAGFAYVSNKEAGVNGVFERVRDLFRNHCRMRPSEEWPKSLDGYDIGYWMAQGCNGVIYEARISDQPLISGAFATPEVPIALDDAPDNSDSEMATPSSAFSNGDYERWLRRKEQYPLAIKLCFNFEFTNNADRILRNMDRERELVPATTKDIQGLLKWNHPIPHLHPNIVDLKTAFIDEIRPLPLAEEKWSGALALGLGGQTLYMVMKRYSMTLRQYILLHRYNYRTARLLLGQLLEAIEYLVSCQIAHRDMKSNNILVDFDHPDEPPRLVLADFGSCLSNGSLKLPYPRDGVDLGGNCALRAPEVVCAVPGLDSYVDFSKSDLWAAGTLAYEIFTRDNPFYFPPPVGLSNITYTENELKPLPRQVPTSVRRLVSHLLKRNPDERPTAAIAANVVALSLFRTEFLRDFLDKFNLLRTGFNGDIVEEFLNWKFVLTDVANLYAAETILGRCVVDGAHGEVYERCRFSKTEEQLRMTFLSRLDSNSLVGAMQYFVKT